MPPPRRSSKRHSSRTLRPNRSASPPGTAAFQRWFGHSKIVDADGEPLVVWHGHRKSVDAFYEFDPERVVDIGYHFGTRRAAEDFGTVRPFYLSIQNPLRLDDPGDWLSGAYSRYGGVPVLDLLAWAGVIDEPEYMAAFDKIAALKQESLDAGFYNGSKGWTLLRAKMSALIVRLLESHGYDGVVYKNETEAKGSTSWIALRPGQIKSADENIGTYDPQNADIRKNGRQLSGATLRGVDMYHGTTEKFSRFEKKYLDSGGAYGPGFYFTNDYPLAKEYSDGGEPIVAHLTLRKPWIVDRNLPYGEGATGRAPFRTKGVRERLMAQGYDGVLVREGEYLEAIVYEPEQIEIIRTPRRR